MLFVYFPMQKQIELALKITTRFYITFSSSQGTLKDSQSHPVNVVNIPVLCMKKAKARENALENKPDPGGWSLGFPTPIPRNMAVLGHLPGTIHNHFSSGQKRLLNGTALLSTNQQTGKRFYSEADECRFQGCFVCRLQHNPTTDNQMTRYKLVFYLKYTYRESECYLFPSGADIAFYF